MQVAVLRDLMRRLAGLRFRKREQPQDVTLSVVEQMVHDLQNPLTSVSGHLQMLLEKEQVLGEAGDRQALTLAYQSTRRLTHVLNSFATAARANAGKLVFSPTPTDLASVVEDTLALLRAPARYKRQSLVVRLDQPLPPVQADRQLLTQALTTLVYHCIKWSSPVDVIHITATPKEGHVVLTLSSPHCLEGLDDLWLRDDGDIKGLFSRYRGAELWLALSRHIVAQCGGHLDARPDAGGRDAIWLALPAASAATAPQSERAQTSTRVA